MIRYVEQKSFDQKFVSQWLNVSSYRNHWTNYGPIAQLLESSVRIQLNIPDDKAVIATASGDAALRAAVLAMAPNQRWLISSFTFACQLQLPAELIVCDCNQHGYIDLPETTNACGLIVTDLFGFTRDRDKYIQYAKKHNLFLLFDSAACYGAKWNDQYIGCDGNATVFSFHHTKPMGFGEGGCLIIDKKFEDHARAAINFGINVDALANLGFNGKISDLSAVYIVDRIRNLVAIQQDYSKQYARIKQIATQLKIDCYLPDEKCIPLPSCVPLLFRHSISPTQLENPYIILQKYYKPLVDTPLACSLYESIVCFPCHPGLSIINDKIIERLLYELSCL